MTGKAGFSGLDDPCGACRRRVGGHTMDEYDTCLRAVTLDLPYEDVPAGPIPLTVDGVDMPWGDHLTARACVVGGDTASALRLLMPAVIFTLQFGNPRGAPVDVGQFGFVGSPEGVRKLGKVLRDTCNGAANAAERSR